MKRKLKGLIVCLLMLMILGLLSTEANAFSIQLRGGGDYFEYFSLGFDMFIYEGRNIDIFVGAEYIDFDDEFDKEELYNKEIYYSGWVMAIPFGIRIKPAMRGRWKPYLSLGGIVGSISYEATEVEEGLDLLSASTDSAIFVAYRAGFGTDIGLTARFSLGIEANYTNSIPEINVEYQDAVVRVRSTGEVREITLTSPYGMLGLNLGLRYYF